MTDKIGQMEERIKNLEKALREYAKPDNWNEREFLPSGDPTKIARKYLELK